MSVSVTAVGVLLQFGAPIASPKLEVNFTETLVSNCAG